MLIIMSCCPEKAHSGEESKGESGSLKRHLMLCQQSTTNKLQASKNVLEEVLEIEISSTYKSCFAFYLYLQMHK